MTPLSSLQVLVVTPAGDVSRLSTRSLTSKEVVMKGTLSHFFKLGQEGKYRVYHNQYSGNTLALNKPQHREDLDKRRHLSHKVNFKITLACTQLKESTET